MQETHASVPAYQDSPFLPLPLEAYVPPRKPTKGGGKKSGKGGSKGGGKKSSKKGSKKGGSKKR